jgi:hypothetical protein
MRQSAAVFTCSRTTRVAILALVLIADGLLSAGATQEAVGVRVEKSRSTTAAPPCPPGSTRTGACDPQPSQTTIRVEKEIVTEIAVRSSKSTQCAAAVALQYTQRNTIARVEGVLENPDCAASRGDYVVAVRVRDETGESKTLEFIEAWRRDDDQPVKFSADYEIGSNVDLTTVGVRRLHCSCVRAEGNEADAED